MTPVCYLDLDCVLVELVKPALRHHGKAIPPLNVRWNLHEQAGMPHDEFWGAFDRTFWATLPWTKGGRRLLAGVEAVFGRDNIVLVSSPTGHPGCDDGKRDWAAHNVPQLTRGQLVLASEKWRLAHPWAVLVDDREDAASAFEARHGKAVLVPAAWNSARHEVDANGDFDPEAVILRAAQQARWAQAVDWSQETP